METDTPLPEEVSADTVYARCDTYSFKGEALQPFTPQRQAAAMACGLKWGSLTEDDKIDCGDGTTSYKQLFADTVIVVWLCSQSIADVRKAIRNPDVALDSAFEWAEKNCMTIRSAAYGEAIGIFGSIMQDLSVSTGVPQYGETSEGAPPIPNA